MPQITALPSPPIRADQISIRRLGWGRPLFSATQSLFSSQVNGVTRHLALLIAPETCSNPSMQRLALNPNLGLLASAIAELPEWVRLELASKNEDLRQRAEEVLVARIAAYLNQTAQYDDEQLILPLQ